MISESTGFAAVGREVSTRPANPAEFDYSTLKAFWRPGLGTVILSE